jgi:hypothetical protein
VQPGSADMVDGSTARHTIAKIRNAAFLIARATGADTSELTTPAPGALLMTFI